MGLQRVVIVGGGCAGLSAAHELVKLNARSGETGVRFEIDVYDRADFLGGKCASQFDVAGTGRLPGEHGFRFFPQFYQHLTATLREIPYPSPGSPGTVFGNLRSPQYGGVAYRGQLTSMPRHLAQTSVDDVVKVLLGDLVGALSPDDLARYSFHLLRFLTSCRARRLTWDAISWEEFLGFDRPGYTEEGKQLLRVVPAVLSAMRARDSSARTIGNTSLQVAFAFHPRDRDPKDGILAGPTTEVWLEPWERYLRANGVRFHLEHTAVDFPVTDGKLDAVVFEHAGERVTVTGDATILAVPIEVTLRLLRAGKLANSTLTNLLTVPISRRWRDERPGDLDAQLRRTWTADMVGVQYYLKEDLRVVNGHLAFPDAEWCLTAVAQQQFWDGGLARFRVPDLRGVYSVILSEWDTPSRRTGKTARQHLSEGDVEGLGRETWAQMQDGLGPRIPLDWANVLHFRVDRHLVPRADPRDDSFNPTPLLIHPVGGYNLRPDGTTGIAGLYVGSDYNRTHVDLASMEGANEGARQAVGAVCADLGIPAGFHPWLRPLDEGAAFAPLQELDAALFKFGLPHVLETGAGGIRAALRRIVAVRPDRLLARLRGRLDADHDGDVDLNDLRLLARSLRLRRHLHKLRAEGASTTEIEARMKG